MRFFKNLTYILAGLFVILHGIAHLPAILGSWNLVTLDDVTRQPNVLLTNISDPFIVALGVIWFLAMVAFIYAGIMILRQSASWSQATLIAIGLSMPMTLLWMNDAIVGLVLNVMILAALAIWLAVATLRPRQMA